MTYALIVSRFVDTRVAIGWLILGLLAVTLCGTCLGLLISAALKRSDYAVAMVPLVILPQILFSEFAIPKESFEGVSEYAYKLMPSRWGYESLLEFAQTSPDYVTAAAKLAALLIFAAIFVLASVPILNLHKY